MDVHQLILSKGSNVIHTLGVSDLSDFNTYEIDVKNRGVLKHVRKSFHGGIYGDILSILSDKFVALDARRSIVLLINIIDGKINLQ